MLGSEYDDDCWTFYRQTVSQYRVKIQVKDENGMDEVGESRFQNLQRHRPSLPSFLLQLWNFSLSGNTEAGTEKKATAFVRRYHW